MTDRWQQQKNVYSIEVLRDLARKRLPKMVFDFIDGGSEDEHTWQRNIDAFRDIALLPHVLRATPDRDLSTTVLGHRLQLPVMVAPTGLTGMFWPQGETAVARACAAAGSIMTVSHATTVSTKSLVETADNPVWAQTLIYNDKGFTREMIERAADAGCHALVLTVDLQALGQRERDLRNGFTVPPKITPRSAFEAMRHPAWLFDYFSNPEITMVNYAGDGKTDLASLAQHMGKIFDSNVSWEDFDFVRKHWDGPLVVKGILRTDDARMAVERGADAIVVSNHGGRQLDGAPSPVEVLPAIAEAVAENAEVYLCSGIRRGSDVIKCLALGARAVLIGRAHLYGVAAGGESGVAASLDILAQEMRRAMALGGWNTISDITRDCVALPADRIRQN